MKGGGDPAETDLDNVFYTAKSEQRGGKRKFRRKSGRKTAMKKVRGGSDPAEADFDSIFGKEIDVKGGTRKTSRRIKPKASKKRSNKRTRRHKPLKKGGHSWSNVGVDRVRRSLQNGNIVESGRLKDYNVFDGAY